MWWLGLAGLAAGLDVEVSARGRLTTAEDEVDPAAVPPVAGSDPASTAAAVPPADVPMNQFNPADAEVNATLPKVITVTAPAGGKLCSGEEPCQLEEALREAQPGDTFELRPGTYEIDTTLKLPKQGKLIVGMDPAMTPGSVVDVIIKCKHKAEAGYPALRVVEGAVNEVVGVQVTECNEGVVAEKNAKLNLLEVKFSVLKDGAVLDEGCTLEVEKSHITAAEDGITTGRAQLWFGDGSVNEVPAVAGQEEAGPNLDNKEVNWRNAVGMPNVLLKISESSAVIAGQDCIVLRGDKCTLDIEESLVLGGDDAILIGPHGTVNAKQTSIKSDEDAIGMALDSKVSCKGCEICCSTNDVDMKKALEEGFDGAFEPGAPREDGMVLVNVPSGQGQGVSFTAALALDKNGDPVIDFKKPKAAELGLDDAAVRTQIFEGKCQVAKDKASTRTDKPKKTEIAGDTPDEGGAGRGVVALLLLLHGAP